MPGLYPNPSAAPEVFNIGDAVKYYVNEKSISPYVGRVVSIQPGIAKVWVEWPVGGKRQHSPEELILIPAESGKPTVNEESGYTNYGIDQSHKNFGKLESEKAPRLSKDNEKTKKMANKVASSFFNNVTIKLAKDISDCYSEGCSEVFTYQKIYKKYSSVCSDHVMRYAIESFYKELDQE